MKKMGKKVSSALIAISLMVGATTYPTQEAKAGVVVAVAGAVASNGSGMLILPAGVAIAMMVGGVGLFSFSCYAFLDKIEYGDNKAAAKAMGFLTLDASADQSNQAFLRNGFMKSYESMNITSNQADQIAEVVIQKLSQLSATPEQDTEILISNEELAPVVESIALVNPELAQKVTVDLTQSSK